MKKIWLIFLIMMVFVFAVECAGNDTEETLPLGTYKLVDAEEPLKPIVILKEDNQFVFSYSALSSYLPIGMYKINENYLIMDTDDGKYHYTFEISEDGALIFKKEDSSAVSLGEIKDGSVFVRQDK